MEPRYGGGSAGRLTFGQEEGNRGIDEGMGF